jgi:hypothetical protein
LHPFVILDAATALTTAEKVDPLSSMKALPGSEARTRAIAAGSTEEEWRIVY